MKGGKKSDEYTVDMVPREVIQHRLLTALESDASQVAALLTEPDLICLIYALENFTVSDQWQVGGADRCRNLAEGMRRLLGEAFQRKIV